MWFIINKYFLDEINGAETTLFLVEDRFHMNPPDSQEASSHAERKSLSVTKARYNIDLHCSRQVQYGFIWEPSNATKYETSKRPTWHLPVRLSIVALLLSRTQIGMKL